MAAKEKVPAATRSTRDATPSTASSDIGHGGEVHQHGGPALTVDHGIARSDNQSSLRAAGTTDHEARFMPVLERSLVTIDAAVTAPVVTFLANTASRCDDREHSVRPLA